MAGNKEHKTISHQILTKISDEQKFGTYFAYLAVSMLFVWIDNNAMD